MVEARGRMQINRNKGVLIGFAAGFLILAAFLLLKSVNEDGAPESPRASEGSRADPSRQDLGESEAGSSGPRKSGRQPSKSTAHGLITTASGLQYEVLREGMGPRPSAQDRVKVDYIGTFEDGTEFDSSYKRSQAVVFPLKNLIKGWIEGLQLMKVGSIYRFVIPPELAYGDKDQAQIPANSTLVFEVELLEIEKTKSK